jgi:DNA-binding transcriptional MocR family regulator
MVGSQRGIQLRADSTRLVECGAPLGVTVAPGSYFRPNAEVSPWIRINAAYAADPRARAFFDAAAQLELP